MEVIRFNNLIDTDRRRRGPPPPPPGDPPPGSSVAGVDPPSAARPSSFVPPSAPDETEAHGSASRETSDALPKQLDFLRGIIQGLRETIDKQNVMMKEKDNEIWQLRRYVDALENTLAKLHDHRSRHNDTTECSTAASSSSPLLSPVRRPPPPPPPAPAPAELLGNALARRAEETRGPRDANPPPGPAADSNDPMQDPSGSGAPPEEVRPSMAQPQPPQESAPPHPPGAVQWVDSSDSYNDSYTDSYSSHSPAAERSSLPPPPLRPWDPHQVFLEDYQNH